MLLHAFLVSVVCTVNGIISPPEVNTPLGKIIGKSESFFIIPVNTFQSIPFAKPPTGALRFQKPQPIEPWPEPIVADKLPPGCVQYSPNNDISTDLLPGKTYDCLYLNVWAPATAGMKGKKTAVMFWIYGGGFNMGSSRLDFYNGIALAALGDVIVVTSNYRVSAEGFLYSGTDDAPGNMGLYDIVEALKWVKSNIKYFGGDEDSITLFGQSSGGIAEGMLMTSPLARGLFVRAIMQSGAPTNMAAEDNSKDFELTLNISRAVGCAKNKNSLTDNPKEVIQCLRGKDAFELAKVSAEINEDLGLLRGFYPRYGDAILPHDARVQVIEGKFEGIDVLIGNVLNEGSAIITSLFEEFFGNYGEKASQINKTFGEEIIRKMMKSFPYPDAVVSHYLGSLDEDEEEQVLYQVQTAAADYTRLCPDIYMAESVAKKGNVVLVYYFVHRPTPSPWSPWMGVVHFDETPFVFGYPLRYPSLYTDPEQLLSIQMIKVWSSFAKYGPKPLLATWPEYSSKQPRYVALDTPTDYIGTGPHIENCNFFRPYFGF